MPDIETAFELEGARTSYGAVPAIEDVSLRVPVHGTVGLVGVNGAGKSTTLRLIAGLMPLHAGKARFFGRLCSTKAGRVIRPGVALVPEGRRLFPEMTVEENLKVGAFRIPSGDIRKELQKVYATFPRLRERRGQKAGTLSGGEQQMAAIGRALMSRPTLLLLDEPTLGLAPKIVETVVALINDIARSEMTIVLVEQNASAALRLTQYMYILDAGRVVHEGTPSELEHGGLVEATILAKEKTRNGGRSFIHESVRPPKKDS